MSLHYLSAELPIARDGHLMLVNLRVGFLASLIRTSYYFYENNIKEL